MMKLTLIVLFCCVVDNITGDKFDTLDRNSDGLLDRSEFSVLSHELHDFIEPFIVGDESHVKASSSGSDVKFSDYFKGDSPSFVPALLNSLVMIIACELGDKTFFIAAVLAMRNGRLIVYLGAMGALTVMHLLSCIMGYTLPALLPKVYTHYASAFLFFYFGLKLLYEAREMGDGPSEELQEVEEELIEKKDEDVEVGEKSSESDVLVYGMKSSQIQIFVQAFTLTFLAEWGDRSQIATVALASSKNPYGIVLGGLVGHALCTALAVVGGRMLAARISERTVTFVGGALFLFFAGHALIAGVES